ncbi:hypothetical protein [Saccharopolyspora griseoalba]|uniref:Uncharacterized protein n=1 Tax=Saccharopolyspora griseoalba TaxID=1431848 RepID=A0ABW2LSF5_9PSEU
MAVEAPATVSDTVAAMHDVRRGLQRVWCQANKLAGSVSQRPEVAELLDTALISGVTATAAHEYYEFEIVSTARRVRTLTAGQLRRLRAAEEHLTGKPAARWLEELTPAM